MAQHTADCLTKVLKQAIPDQLLWESAMSEDKQKFRTFELSLRLTTNNVVKALPVEDLNKALHEALHCREAFIKANTPSIERFILEIIISSVIIIAPKRLIAAGYVQSGTHR